MEIILTIDGVDRTSLLDLDSVVKTDLINERADVLEFRIRKTKDSDFVPESGKEVILTLNGERVFGGTLIRIRETTNAEKTVVYDIECSDYTFDLNRRLVTNRYTNQTAKEIVIDIINNHTDGFTTNNVLGEIEFKTIAFDHLTVAQCLQKIAQTINYFWYVDYFKDVHFFKKNDELAPFGLTDGGGNHIYDSLSIDKDLSQIRNTVTVKGGESEGEQRTEEFTAEGDEDERTYYRLAHKFSELPTVTVNDVEVTVGTEFLSNDEDFDAMWSFQEKYIRFTEGNIPVANDIVKVTGIPLLSILVRVRDDDSISQFGVFEFRKEDPGITSRDQAIDLGLAELEAYAQSISEGSFRTYVNGLRSGQVININSSIRGINENFLIQSVRFRFDNTKERLMYDVSIATLRTIGIIEVLQNLLLDKKITQGEDTVLLSLVNLDDEAEFSDNLPANQIKATSPPYFWVDEDTGEGLENPILWNKWSLVENEFPTWRQDDIKQNSGNSDTPNVEAPNNIKENDLIILFLFANNTSGVTSVELTSAPSNFKLIRFETSGGVGHQKLWIYYKKTSGNEPVSYQFSLDNVDHWIVQSIRITDHDIVPIGTDNGVNSGSAVNNLTIPSINVFKKKFVGFCGSDKKFRNKFYSSNRDEFGFWIRRHPAKYGWSNSKCPNWGNRK